MPKGVMIVQSRPVSADREEEYNAWYSSVHISRDPRHPRLHRRPPLQGARPGWPGLRRGLRHRGAALRHAPPSSSSRGGVGGIGPKVAAGVARPCAMRRSRTGSAVVSMTGVRCLGGGVLADFRRLTRLVFIKHHGDRLYT
jgi:hypothetical protein